MDVRQIEDLGGSNSKATFFFFPCFPTFPNRCIAVRKTLIGEIEGGHEMISISDCIAGPCGSAKLSSRKFFF